MFKRPIRVAVVVLSTCVGGTLAANAEERLALVVGQSAYESGELPSSLTDAGLIADTLKTAGFNVTEARDLSQDDMRRAVRDFSEQVRAAGREAVAVVYFSGIGLQLEGENYLLPVDAKINEAADVPMEGFRLDDLLRSLSATQSRANIVILDAANGTEDVIGKTDLTPGLALAEAPERTLIAFSAAPNTLSVEVTGSYGPYATALAEMMRKPGRPLDRVFADTRLRVHDVTNGAQIPWFDANLGTASFVFFPGREETTSSVGRDQPREARRAGRPNLRSLPPEEAYLAAIEADDVEVYQDFLEIYPREPFSERVVVILANRRETVIWRETVRRNTREAYWTYARLYPNGPHARDVRRRLARIGAPERPPERFAVVEYDVLPPPLPIVERYEFRDRYVRFDDLPRAPRVTERFLEPQPRAFIDLREQRIDERRRDGRRDGAPDAATTALPPPPAPLPAPETARAVQPGTVRTFGQPAATPPATDRPAAEQRTAPTEGSPTQGSPTQGSPTRASPAQQEPAARQAPSARQAPASPSGTSGRPTPDGRPQSREAAPSREVTPPERPSTGTAGPEGDGRRETTQPAERSRPTTDGQGTASGRPAATRPDAAPAARDAERPAASRPATGSRPTADDDENRTTGSTPPREERRVRQPDTPQARPPRPEAARPDASRPERPRAAVPEPQERARPTAPVARPPQANERPPQANERLPQASERPPQAAERPPQAIERRQAAPEPQAAPRARPDVPAEVRQRVQERVEERAAGGRENRPERPRDPRRLQVED